MVVGVDILEEAVTSQKRQAIRQLVKVLKILGKARTRLKVIAPVLESVLFDLLWFSLLKGQYTHLFGVAASDPKVAARAAGTISVQLGRKALDSRLTVTSVLWTLVMQFAIKLATSIPAAANATVNQFKDTDSIQEFKVNLDSSLHSVGIVMSDTEKNAIVKEIKAYPKEIAEIFKNMVNDMKLLNGL